MSKLLKTTDKHGVAEALFSLINFINDSYALRSCLDILRDLTNTSGNEKPLPENKVPGWIWLIFVRWKMRYTDSWVGIGKISTILKERWGTTQWVDECRGDLFALVMPLLIDPGWTPSFIDSIRERMNKFDVIAKRQIENDERFVENFERAEAMAQHTGEGMITNSDWTKQEELHAATSKEAWRQSECLADEMVGNPLTIRIVGYARSTSRSSEFNRRLVRVENRAATLTAINCDDKPPAEQKQTPNKQFDPSVLGVLRRLAESKTSMTIEDIAGTPGCPKAEKTVRNIVKTLIADGLVARPHRGRGAIITESGRAAI